MVAIYSLWNGGNRNNTARFLSIDDLMRSLHLSVLLSKKYFEKIIFVTDDIGLENVSKYKIPFDEVSLKLNNLNINNQLWAYSKIYACTNLHYPFVHIDNDFFLMENPIPLLSKGDFLFQNKESFSRLPGLYYPIIEIIKQISGNIFFNNELQFAVNCGIIGCNRPDLIASVIDRANKLIEYDKLIERVVLEPINVVPINLIIEQHFFAQIIFENNCKTIFLEEDEYNLKNAKFQWLHLWAEGKRQKKYLDWIRQQLKIEMDSV